MNPRRNHVLGAAGVALTLATLVWALALEPSPALHAGKHPTRGSGDLRERAATTTNEAPTRTRVEARHSAAAPDAPTQAVETPTELTVLAHDQEGRPIGCQVEVVRRRRVEATVHCSSLDGRGVIRPAPGEFQCRVVPSSLPQGWLQPIEQHSSRPGQARLGSQTPEHRIAEGEQLEVSIQVWRAATLRGTVFGPDGHPQPHMVVRASSTGGSLPLPVSHDDHTDGSGAFELPLYPGTWLVRSFKAQGSIPVEGGQRRPHPLVGVPVPEPARVEARPGEQVRLDIRYVWGNGVVRGRVVDQFGEPFPGLRVTLYPRGQTFNVVVQSGTTDEHGMFLLAGVPGGEYSSWITDTATDLEGTRAGLSEWIDSIPVDVSDETSDQSIGDVLAVRNATMHGAGVVRGATDGMALRVIVPQGVKQREGRKDLVLHPALDGDGQFRWSLPVGLGGTGRMELTRGSVTRTWDFQLEETSTEAPYTFVLE